MKVWVVVFSLSLFVQVTVVQGQLKSGWCLDYGGTLGKSARIGMSLFVQDQRLKGSYFYNAHLTDIPLRGRYTASRDILLTENGPRGETRGTFQLHFAESDSHFKSSEPLQTEVLNGTWTSADGKRTYPVHLQMEQNCPAPGKSRYAVAGASNDEIVEKNAQAFYSAILAGDREKAARFVSYPSTIFSNGNQKVIKNASDCLKVYSQIFSPTFAMEIAAGVLHHMFANAQGIMIADGKVWFDETGKAKHFNNETRAQ